MANSPIFVDNFKDLIGSCISYYEENKHKASFERIRAKRAKLSGFAEAFHKDAGTLTASVQKRLEDLKNGNCLVLMTAHQPNFFAYGGVLRKATLTFVLAKTLEEILKVPVVNFFGIADQDFADDRWVKSALLPDVERRGGVLELRFDLPEKLLLNRVVKPSRQILNGWQAEIEKWFGRKLSSIGRFSKSFGLEFDWSCNRLAENFEDFWAIVETAHGRAEVFSDFNAFIMSRVINEAWGYDTLFSRFSECQQMFEDEFSFLLSHSEEYSGCLKEAASHTGHNGEGVYNYEHETIPFWYHCDCGSKARLIAGYRGDHLIGRGKCLRCEKEYTLDFGLRSEPRLSGILSKISARSISMPLVFFGGLDVGCYVGGVGGKEYLCQAGFVAGNMGLSFPPIVVWRPRDVYFGVGQLEAVMMFRRLSSSFDFSKFPAAKAALEGKIVLVQENIDRLEHQKMELAKNAHVKKEDAIERTKVLSSEQAKIRQEVDFSLMVHDLKLLENIESAMSLHPCMVDYAVNVGLKPTSEQWIAFLEETGSFHLDVPLKTEFQDFALGLQRLDGL